MSCSKILLIIACAIIRSGPYRQRSTSEMIRIKEQCPWYIIKIILRQCHVYFFGGAPDSRPPKVADIHI